MIEPRIDADSHCELLRIGTQIGVAKGSIWAVTSSVLGTILREQVGKGSTRRRDYEHNPVQSHDPEGSILLWEI